MGSTWGQPAPSYLGGPPQGLGELLPMTVQAAQRVHRVRVPLPRRRLQKRHAALRPGSAPADTRRGRRINGRSAVCSLVIW
jgi:hypothetical protein